MYNIVAKFCLTQTAETMPSLAPLPAGYRLELVAQPLPPDLAEQIIQTWLHSGALRDREKAEKRLGQVLAIARAPDQSLAAVASVYVAPVAALGDIPMFHFRVFTAPSHRRQKLGGHLGTQVRGVLEQRFGAMTPAQQAVSPLGLYIALENKDMHANYNHAILPVSMAAYIGDTAKGQRQYVYYFAEARVPVTAIKSAQGPRP